MKFRLLTFGLVLMILGLSAAGCGGEPEPEITEIVSVNQDIIEVMKIMPPWVTVFFSVDLKQIREDGSLSDLYENLSKKDYFDERGANTLGIFFSDVNVLVLAANTTPNQRYAVLKGEFDFENIRQRLADNGFYKQDNDNYQDIEIWKEHGLYFTFFKDFIFIFDDYRNEDAIFRLFQGQGSSMYDDAGFSAMIDMLPPGLGYSLIKNEFMDGQVNSLAVYKPGDKMFIRGWYGFLSEADAESYILDIEQNLELLFSECNIDSIQHQHLIEIRGETDIDNGTASDFWKHYGIYY